MKKLMRMISCLLAAVMVMGMMTLSVAADGEGTGESGSEGGYKGEYSYVLNYNGKMRYLSVYKPRALWYAKNPAGTRTGIIFGLYDTVNKNYIDTYCMDVNTGTEEGFNYRRLNLEDSIYSENTASLVRSIMLNGFPHKSVEEIVAATKIEGLTVCEAIMATQLAVWEAVHGDMFTVTDFYATDRYLGNSAETWNENKIEFFNMCNAEVISGYAENNEALVEANMEALYNYLLNLPPTPPVSSNIAVSNESFVSWDIPVVSEKSDGTYNVTVNAKVNVTEGADDELTLSAVLCDDNTYYKKVELGNGENNICLTIENIPTVSLAYSKVKLAIDGKQTVSDVFMFDAEGERGVSQTLVGITDKQLPVHAEVIAEQEREITFIKHGRIQIGEDENGNPIYTSLLLSGITFDLYLVADYTEYIENYVQDGLPLPDPKKVCELGTDGKNYPDFTVVTDADGRANINLTKNNLPDGVYAISERKNDAIETVVDPFYVMIPNTNANQNDWDYHIEIQPKNIVKKGPEIRKDVIAIEHEDKSGLEEQCASVAAGEAFAWVIRSDIPVDMAKAKEYVITDELDYRLTFVDDAENPNDDVVITVETIASDAYSASASDVLVNDVDYKLDVTTSTINVDANGNVVTDGSGTAKDIQKLEVKLTAAGMGKVAKLAGEDYAKKELRVYFNTIVDSDAAIGEQIPNEAGLAYISSVGFSYKEKSDKPSVYTCGIDIYKYNAKNEAEALGGAKFKLLKLTDEQDSDAVTLVTQEGKTVFVKYVAFYNNPEMTGDKQYEVTTSFDNIETENVNEGGQAYMYGLADGDYYLIETKAPEGYNLLRYPVKVKLDKTKTLGFEKVANSNAFILPETGGIGTLIFKICGGALIMTAVVVLIVKKMRENKEEDISDEDQTE